MEGRWYEHFPALLVILTSGPQHGGKRPWPGMEHQGLGAEGGHTTSWEFSASLVASHMSLAYHRREAWECFAWIPEKLVL